MILFITITYKKYIQNLGMKKKKIKLKVQNVYLKFFLLLLFFANMIHNVLLMKYEKQVLASCEQEFYQVTLLA